MRWLLTSLLLLLSGSVAHAHGPELTALVTLSERGELTIQMVDPLLTPVVGAAAFVHVGELHGQSVRLRLSEGPPGHYAGMLSGPPGETLTIEFEAELSYAQFRTTFQWRAGDELEEQPFPVREITKRDMAWWELILYGGVTVGIIVVLVAALYYVPREPTS